MNITYGIFQVVFVLYYLRGPLKIGENVGMATMFLSTLTPKGHYTYDIHKYCSRDYLDPFFVR